MYTYIQGVDKMMYITRQYISEDYFRNHKHWLILPIILLCYNRVIQNNTNTYSALMIVSILHAIYVNPCVKKFNSTQWLA